MTIQKEPFVTQNQKLVIVCEDATRSYVDVIGGEMHQKPSDVLAWLDDPMDVQAIWRVSAGDPPQFEDVSIEVANAWLANNVPDLDTDEDYIPPFVCRHDVWYWWVEHGRERSDFDEHNTLSNVYQGTGRF